MATKNRTEFVTDVEFIQKHRRDTVEDGILWAHMLIDGRLNTDYMNFVMNYYFTEVWHSAMINELIRLAQAGMPAHAQASTQT